MARIFISYKRVDKDKVIKIKNQIESALGEKCWIDLDGIESHAIFASKIIGAINNCDIFLFMYSKSHEKIVDFETDWTIRELNFAQSKNKRIVFINLDGSALTDWFSLILGTKQQVNGQSKQAIMHLCNDIKDWRNTATFSDEDKSFHEVNTHNERSQNICAYGSFHPLVWVLSSLLFILLTFFSFFHLKLGFNCGFTLGQVIYLSEYITCLTLLVLILNRKLLAYCFFYLILFPCEIWHLYFYWDGYFTGSALVDRLAFSSLLLFALLHLLISLCVRKNGATLFDQLNSLRACLTDKSFWLPLIANVVFYIILICL